MAARSKTLSCAQTLQNLCILAAEIQQGNTIHAGDANHASPYNAAKAIAGLIARILRNPVTSEDPSLIDFINSHGLFPAGIDDDDFWRNMAFFDWSDITLST